MSAKPRVLILRAAGTNCDRETAHAFDLAGGQSEAVHVNRLIESPKVLSGFQILAIPGGFSYGDDIAAGRILAGRLTRRLAGPMREFVDAGKPILGICNGFQVLLRAGLLGADGVTLTSNDTPRFVDKWVTLEKASDRCLWTRDLAGPLEVPIAHGEGRVAVAGDDVLDRLHAAGQVALTYADNPNGSAGSIAGLCDPTGRVLGLMPHPERHVTPTQHPAWSARSHETGGAGLTLFRSAIEAA